MSAQADWPTTGDVAAWCKTDPANPHLGDALAAAVDAQTQRLRVDPYTAGLRMACLRRAARHLAGQGVPLGIVVGEYGSDRLARFDAITDDLEQPYERTQTWLA